MSAVYRFGGGGGYCAIQLSERSCVAKAQMTKRMNRGYFFLIKYQS